MKNPFFLSLVFLLCYVQQTIAQSQTETKADKPNIIFILVDDMGFGDVGVFFQNKRKQDQDFSKPWTSTPNFDKMAAEGAMLTQHYVPAPVCAPSRASLLSGLSQGHADLRDNQFDKALIDNHTLGTVMQTAGYQTGAIGKWGMQGIVSEENEDPEHWPAYPTKRGFDYFYGYVRHMDGHEHYPANGVYRGKKEVWENDKEVSAGLNNAYTTDLWTAAAKKYITQETKGNNKNKPFFLYLAYDTPHAVMELPTQAYPEGAGLNGGLQWTGKPGEMINTASGTPDSWVHPEYADAVYDDDNDPNTPLVAWPDTYKRYATSVRRIDSAVGDLLQLLKDLDIDSNTLVVFASDNGPSIESYLPEGYVFNNANFFDSFGPYDGIKRDVLEGGLRTPLIAHWPGTIPEKRVVETPSIFYDWLPTFTNAAGLPAPVNTDGVSLLPALTGKGEQQEGNIYVEYFESGKTPNYEEFAPANREKKRMQMQMIRVGDHVGLRYDVQSADDDFGMFDILEDTHQGNDLATDGDLAELQKSMKAKVLQRRRPNASAPRPYDSVPVPAVPVSDLKNGILWKAYDGDFPWLPQVKGLSIAEEGVLTKPGFTETAQKNHNVFVFEGYIAVPKEGEYTFSLKTNGNTFLKLHDINLLDGDFKYEYGNVLEAKIVLEKGVHPFRLYYKKKNGVKPKIDLQWASADFQKRKFSPKETFLEK